VTCLAPTAHRTASPQTPTARRTAPGSAPSPARRPRSRSVLHGLAVALISLAAAACRQGAGERCEVTSDCADGLTCSQAEPKVCGGTTSSEFDADFPDADFPGDAAVPDASTDASVDASVDASTAR
jgi:hypothetical protein